MKRNVESNREKLATEVVNQMDMKDMMAALKELLETYYEELNATAFNEEWNGTFGED